MGGVCCERRTRREETASMRMGNVHEHVLRPFLWQASRWGCVGRLGAVRSADVVACTRMFVADTLTHRARRLRRHRRRVRRAAACVRCGRCPAVAPAPAAATDRRCCRRSPYPELGEERRWMERELCCIMFGGQSKSKHCLFCQQPARWCFVVSRGSSRDTQLWACGSGTRPFPARSG